MFFTTYPRAENSFLSSLNTENERSWDWVEFSINTPMYLVSADYNDDGLILGRTFIFGNLRDLFEFLANQDSEYSNFSVSLLSPGYLNGTSSYQLGVLKEIWIEPSSNSHLFVLGDGQNLSHSSDGKKLNKKRMQKLISF